MLQCNDPDVVGYQNQVRVYSNKEYQRGYSNNIVTVLFRGEGEVYIEAEEKVKGCTRIMAYRPSKEIGHMKVWKDYL